MPCCSLSSFDTLTHRLRRRGHHQPLSGRLRRPVAATRSCSSSGPLRASAPLLRLLTVPTVVSHSKSWTVASLCPLCGLLGTACDLRHSVSVPLHAIAALASASSRVCPRVWARPRLLRCAPLRRPTQHALQAQTASKRATCKPAPLRTTSSATLGDLLPAAGGRCAPAVPAASLTAQRLRRLHAARCSRP